MRPGSVFCGRGEFRIGLAFELDVACTWSSFVLRFTMKRTMGVLLVFAIDV